MAESDAELRSKVRAWARDSVERVSIWHAPDMDLDLLMKLPPEKAEQLRLGFVAFDALVEYVLEIDSAVQPMLVIALNSPKRLVTKRPEGLAGVIKDMDDLIPPCLYLLDWTTKIVYQGCQEYRCPITLEGVTLPANTFAYYRCWNDRIDDPNDWARYIDVVYYPPRYQRLPLPVA